jgi:SAM-dependent methyltransferase
MKGGPRAEWWNVMMEGAQRVLDIGCGFGFPSFYLASCGRDVVGIDPSPSEIAMAERFRREEGPNLQLKYQVVEQNVLPFPDASFDGATLGNSLECSGDPEQLIREVIRVLRPGSPVALDEEDRTAEPKTHPVWEKRRLVLLDDTVYMHVEVRVCDPYLDRRYMIQLAHCEDLKARFTGEPEAHNPGRSISLESAALPFERLLPKAVSAEYGEARGYDALTLRDFLQSQGLSDLRYWVIPRGKEFVQQLLAARVASEMPDDIRAVSRALVLSVANQSRPTTLVSCKTPQTRMGEREK